MVYHFALSSLTNFFLGAGLGVAGGLLGIGGGLIAIPILTYLYGMDQHLAQGTALVMIAPNVLIGFLRYRQKNNIELRSVAPMILFATLAAYAAARFVTGIGARSLQVTFALFLVALAIYFGWQFNSTKQLHTGKDTASGTPVAMPASALPLLGIVSGGMSGIFTVGGGLVVVPALVSFFGMAQTRAQGMALALVVPGALIALVTYAHAGYVSWGIGIPLALGGMMSISWGVALAHRFSPARLRISFCAVLLLTALMMLWPK